MRRFALQWLVPGQPERLTHVMLLDRERPAPYTLAVGYGSDKVQALLTLWQALDESDAAAEALDYVSAEYERRTGIVPEKSAPRPQLKGRKA